MKPFVIVMTRPDETVVLCMEGLGLGGFVELDTRLASADPAYATAVREKILAMYTDGAKPSIQCKLIIDALEQSALNPEIAPVVWGVRD